MRLTASIDIDAPVELVWRCIDEPELIVRWVEGALEHRYLTPRDPANPVGQKFIQRLRQGSQVKTFEGTLIAFERLRHFAFVIPSPSYSSEAHFRLDAQGPARTHVNYSIDVTLHTFTAKLAAAGTAPAFDLLRAQTDATPARPRDAVEGNAMSAASDPTSRMARLLIGDWWEYDGQGATERAGHSMQLIGTIRVSVEQREAGGQLRSAIVFQPRWRIIGVDGDAAVFPMPGGLFYFVQDDVTGDVSITGDNMGPGGADRFALSPQVFYPGHFDATTSYSNVLDFGALGKVVNTLRTSGVETVHTVLGDYAAWKAPITSESELFGKVEGIDHWRPALGAPLRFEMSAVGPDGSRLTTVAVLRATDRLPG